jgi:hypothetical protein
MKSIIKHDNLKRFKIEHFILLICYKTRAL